MFKLYTGSHMVYNRLYKHIHIQDIKEKANTGRIYIITYNEFIKNKIYPFLEKLQLGGFINPPRREMHEDGSIVDVYSVVSNFCLVDQNNLTEHIVKQNGMFCVHTKNIRDRISITFSLYDKKTSSDAILLHYINQKKVEK